MTDNLPKDQDFNSVFTNNLPEILKQLNISLAVSTYQCGKLILLRRADGVINTHYRNFNRPMGIAIKPNRISIGCNTTVITYQNVPDVIPKLESPEKYDACYVPRHAIETGHIDIHEMAWGNKNSLWMINTRFSCLCTLDTEHSFVPQWRPHFISALANEDRCHLNGLGMKGGIPKYPTALGITDTEGGWRANKRNGGIVLDIEKNKIIQNILIPIFFELII